MNIKHLRARALRYVQVDVRKLDLRYGAPSAKAWSDAAYIEPLEQQAQAAMRAQNKDYMRVRVLNHRVLHDDGESRSFAVTIRAPNEDIAKLWVSHVYGETRCQHDYDCCGHWYRSSPKMRHVKRREYVVITSSYLNI